MSINFIRNIIEFQNFKSEIKKILPSDYFSEIEKSLSQVNRHNRESVIHFLKLGCSFDDANNISKDIFEILKNTPYDLDTILNDTKFCLMLMGKHTLRNTFTGAFEPSEDIIRALRNLPNSSNF